MYYKSIEKAGRRPSTSVEGTQSHQAKEKETLAVDSLRSGTGGDGEVLSIQISKEAMRKFVS